MKFLKELSEILFPLSYTCDVCGIETFEGNICKDCAKNVPLNNGVTCPVCGRRTVRPEICIECKDRAPIYEKAVSALVYDKAVVTLVYKFKNGSAYLKEYFARLLAEKIAALPECDFITYVPMTKEGVAKRGYNQAELLAKSLSEQTGIPVVAVLEKVKKTKEQKSLTKSEREENLKTSFKVADRAAVKGKRILLVDDVMTTGATVEIIAKKLLSAGAEKIYVATASSVEFKA